MPRAAMLIRPLGHYRADVFSAGLRHHGYQVEAKWHRSPGPDDLLVIWNRNRAFDPIAQIYESQGARVVVAENGYLDRGPDGVKFYALALEGHNGSGRWFVGDSPRFEVDEQPWRSQGSKILVLPQRGIGKPGIAMPTHWVVDVERRLGLITDREIMIRKHPGHQRAEAPLNFRDVHCAVTWGSGAAIKALRAGIPVFHDLSSWIGAAGAAPLADDIEHCHCPDRRLLWTRVTWAQWTLDEIGSGEAFDRLLNDEDRCLFRSSPCSLGHDRAGDGAGDRQIGRSGRAQAVDHASRPLPV